MERVTAREVEYTARMALDLSFRLKHKYPRDASWTNVFTFAESCTGGMLASLVASVPGVSAVFPGSVVTYSNRAKIEHLAVTPETLSRHGAVSAQCAAEMAWGSLRLFDTIIAVSVTGIAGPDGGSEEKPVGTVWFAIAHADGRMRLQRGYYPGRPRNDIQMIAALSAIRLLIKGLRYEIG
jgi:PncC family amidohydrolase